MSARFLNPINTNFEPWIKIFSATVHSNPQSTVSAIESPLNCTTLDIPAPRGHTPFARLAPRIATFCACAENSFHTISQSVLSDFTLSLWEWQEVRCLRTLQVAPFGQHQESRPLGTGMNTPEKTHGWKWKLRPSPPKNLRGHWKVSPVPRYIQ